MKLTNGKVIVMLRIKRVLHATDFSPSSRSAMAYSLLLARKLDTRLDVLHVISGIGANRISQYDRADARDEVLDRAFGELGDLAARAGLTARFLVGRGPLPGPVILEEAQAEGANLIILGAHGGGEAQPDQLGSVATDIVRRSTCPVMIIPPHVEESAVDEKMERVLTVISYSHLIEPLVDVSAEIAHMFNAKLDILAQIDGADVGSPHWREEEKKLRDILLSAERKGRTALPIDRIELHAVGARTADDVIEFARRRHSDMLILEAPGLASMDSPFERAVEDILGRAPCPVVLINTCGRAITQKSHSTQGQMADATA